MCRAGEGTRATTGGSGRATTGVDDRMFGIRKRRNDPPAERARGGGPELVLPSADPAERAHALSRLQEQAGHYLDSGALADREDLRR
ncbi:hypothetical protein [Streptomyces qinzhouensis]|uniref:Uncharacterized protein n=1 Tax=Streptomyces qinzhouensis TaxID=2599401 RepID=A0A5B8JF06_9ACTN|nr:hypothetical protein [Streptomyces qinzhouensis]QDY80046.1 hypothetical protein FQU76_29905 [Streptomyces qinzhouensis]